MIEKGERAAGEGYILAWEKGEKSEEKVYRALEKLKQEEIIRDFGQTIKFSQEDLRGKDFVIITNDEKAIWLQVKSSFNPAKQKKYLRRGIYYIAIQQKTPLEIREEILGILRDVEEAKSQLLTNR